MKIITLFKSFLAVGVTAAGITSAVVFSNINNITAPFVRVLTKSDYEQIKAAQGTKNININYATLPTSSETVVDLLTSKSPEKNAFMFTVGSQAYANTNLLLNGINKEWDDGANPDIFVPSGSLMLDLYDAFYSGNYPKLSSINMSFFSYIDIVSTKNYQEGLDVLNYRRTQLGNVDPEITIGNGESRLWNVLNTKGNLDPAAPNLQPVVKDGSKFIYYPNYDSFYEFRPNDKHDTQYERIYYRRDAKTKEFLDATSWVNTYATSNLNVPFAREGSLFCAKYNSLTSAWEFKSFIGTDEFQNGRNKTVEEIINFYLL